MYKNKEIIKYIDGKKEKIFDSIVIENQINVFLNKKLLVRIMCLPYDIEALIYGFFFSNGFIDKPQDIKELKITGNNCYIETKKEFSFNNLAIGTSCFSSFFTIEDIIDTNRNFINIEKFDIVKIMQKFQKMGELYKKTGGTHSAALCDEKENIYFFSEDIGRHNAVDKVIGKAILNNYNTEGKILLTSGRISSEIVFKSKKAKFAAVVSSSAPTSLAVEVAKKFKIVLVGFARGKRYNVYDGF